MREELMEIIENIMPGLDWEDEDIDLNEELDSMDIIALMADIEEKYDVNIDMNLRTADNFKNLDSLCCMIKSLLQDFSLIVSKRGIEYGIIL